VVPTHPRTVVVGSGLAGLAAAVRLTDAGHRVTILERSPFLGGRTANWVDDGMEVETGLHRYLGFYTRLPRLMRHVGVPLRSMITWTDEIEMRVPDGGPSATFSTSLIHRPLRSIASVLGNNHYVPWAQKLALARMLTAGVCDYILRPRELDDTSVADYARRYRVSDTTIFRILTPLTEGLFFVPPDVYSARNFMGIIVPYWKSVLLTRVGSFTGGMGDVMCAPLANYVIERGGSLVTSTPVDELLVDDQGVRGVSAAGRQIDADRVVLAASLGGAQAILNASAVDDPWFGAMHRLQSTPSVCYQAELDEPCMPADHATFGPGTALASFSEQSRTTFRETDGRLSAILAHPREHLGKSAKELTPLVIAEARRIGVELEGHILRARVTEVPDDFYSLEVGNQRLRPPQETPVPGLALAGDYTRQPYLATMEGAVVSGQRAARAILRRS
jgi:15-cis-phytoene desaturase